LQERARSVGVQPIYGCAISTPDELGDADLIVGADGINSLLRAAFAAQFGTTTCHLSNRFAWFGTTRRFETLTQTFRATALGNFNAHHYRYAPEMSTFIVETDAATFASVGFERMNEERSKAICEEIFAEELEGHRLVTNRSFWRQFPRIRNERWWHCNFVLVGDALRTAHFSIGSGTRLAMEDVIALRSSAAGERRRRGSRASRLRSGATADRRETGRGRKCERRLVRALCRAHAARAARLCDELHHAFRQDRPRAAACCLAWIRCPVRGCAPAPSSPRIAAGSNRHCMSGRSACKNWWHRMPSEI
jgi:2-polyprenyl-6-methoxyphenol hydroxylase-like FAD-dependent oxidoreductase